MLIIPAIDIKDGHCVRLYQGLFERKVLYSNDPLEVAKRWEKEGAKWLHLIDLDGAQGDPQKNQAVILGILKNTGLKIQLGGGIRSLEDVERWFSWGVERVILSTRAILDEEFLKEALKIAPERIVLALDVKEGELMIDGWRKGSGLKVLDFAKRAKDLGVRLFIYTDILRDGTIAGPNFQGAEALSSLQVPFILSGGISSLEDIERSAKIPYLVGVIIGKALYEGKIDLKEAIRRFGEG